MDAAEEKGCQCSTSFQVLFSTKIVAIGDSRTLKTIEPDTGNCSMSKITPGKLVYPFSISS